MNKSEEKMTEQEALEIYSTITQAVLDLSSSIYSAARRVGGLPPEESEKWYLWEARLRCLHQEIENAREKFMNWKGQ